MSFVIGLLGVVQMLAGLAIYSAASSAMHEIFAATTFGLGVLALGVAVAIAELQGIGRRIDAREAGDLDRHEATKQIATAFERMGKRQTAQGGVNA